MASLQANNIDSTIDSLLNNPIIYVYGILLLLFSLSLYKSARITVEILQNLCKQRNKNKKHPNPTTRVSMSHSLCISIYIFKMFVTALLRHNLCIIKFTHLSVCFDKS